MRAVTDSDAVDLLLARRVDITRDVVDTLYARHPEWWDRWGPSGHAATTRDVGYHLEFLEAALRADREEVFLWYTRWLAGILMARNVPLEAVAESYTLLAQRLEDHVPKDTAHALHELLLEASRVLERIGEVGAPVPGARRPDQGAHDIDDERVAALVEALLAGDRPTAEGILRDALAAGTPFPVLGDDLVQPAMTEVGRRWQENVISVAEEHLASATLSTAFTFLVSGQGGGAPADRDAVLACVEGNRHAIGLRAVADVFELAGWRVSYLGADVPTGDLVRYVRDHAMDLVGLSLALPGHLASARRTITALRAATEPDTPRIVVGGLAVREFPALADVVGADAAAFGAVDAGREAAR